MQYTAATNVKVNSSSNFVAHSRTVLSDYYTETFSRSDTLMYHGNVTTVVNLMRILCTSEVWASA